MVEWSLGLILGVVEEFRIFDLMLSSENGEAISFELLSLNVTSPVIVAPSELQLPLVPLNVVGPVMELSLKLEPLKVVVPVMAPSFWLEPLKVVVPVMVP